MQDVAQRRAGHQSPGPVLCLQAAKGHEGERAQKGRLQRHSGVLAGDQAVQFAKLVMPACDMAWGGGTGTRVFRGNPVSLLVNQPVCELRCGDAPGPSPPAQVGGQRGPEKANTARTAQSPPCDFKSSGVSQSRWSQWEGRVAPSVTRGKTTSSGKEARRTCGLMGSPSRGARADPLGSSGLGQGPPVAWALAAGGAPAQQSGPSPGVEPPSGQAPGWAATQHARCSAGGRSLPGRPKPTPLATHVNPLLRPPSSIL